MQGKPMFAWVLVVVCWLGVSVDGTVRADSPFATVVIEYEPAPGQFVNVPEFNDPSRALGAPVGGGTVTPDNTSLVTLGGFGGTVTLGFDHTVLDDPLNPLGLDAIVFGNAYWVGGHHNRHWAECGHIEISRDVNGNGLPDDSWYLLPGSHITDPADQYTIKTWDDDIADPTYPPDEESWIPPGQSGVWTTAGYRLPPDVFDTQILENPNGLDADEEGIFGYADFAPTLVLGDTDVDNVVDDPGLSPEEFYTVPDNPWAVGMTPGSGGGDAFDIAGAIDPLTGAPAGLDGFDFIRITTAVDFLAGPFTEVSTEIDAVSDVTADPRGDYDEDGDIDLADFAGFQACLLLDDIAGSLCELLDFDGDGSVDLADLPLFSERTTGPR